MGTGNFSDCDRLGFWRVVSESGYPSLFRGRPEGFSRRGRYFLRDARLGISAYCSRELHPIIYCSDGRLSIRTRHQGLLSFLVSQQIPMVASGSRVFRLAWPNWRAGFGWTSLLSRSISIQFLSKQLHSLCGSGDFAFTHPNIFGGAFVQGLVASVDWGSGAEYRSLIVH